MCSPRYIVQQYNAISFIHSIQENVVATYYEAYKNGFRAGEIDGELGNTEGANFAPPPAEANPDAWRETQLWGYQDGLEGNEMRSARCVEMHVDSNFHI